MAQKLWQTDSGTGASNNTIAFDADELNSGQLLLLFVYHSGSGLTTPAGWTKQGECFAYTFFRHPCYVFSKISDGSETDFSLTNVQSWVLQAWSGVDPDNISFSAQHSTGTAANSQVSPSIVASDRGVVIYGVFGYQTDWNPTSPLVARTNGGATGLFFATNLAQKSTVGGATGTHNWSHVSGGVSTVANPFTVVLQDTVVPVPTQNYELKDDYLSALGAWFPGGQRQPSDPPLVNPNTILDFSIYGNDLINLYGQWVKNGNPLVGDFFSIYTPLPREEMHGCYSSLVQEPRAETRTYSIWLQIEEESFLDHGADKFALMGKPVFGIGSDPSFGIYVQDSATAGKFEVVAEYHVTTSTTVTAVVEVSYSAPSLQWNNIIVTVDPDSDMKIYLNGSLADTQNISSYAPVDINNTTDYFGVGAQYPSGAVDVDTAIHGLYWDAAIVLPFITSAGQITELSTARHSAYTSLNSEDQYAFVVNWFENWKMTDGSLTESYSPYPDKSSGLVSIAAANYTDWENDSVSGLYPVIEQPIGTSKYYVNFKEGRTFKKATLPAEYSILARCYYSSNIDSPLQFHFAATGGITYTLAVFAGRLRFFEYDDSTPENSVEIFDIAVTNSTGEFVFRVDVDEDSLSFFIEDSSNPNSWELVYFYYNTSVALNTYLRVGRPSDKPLINDTNDNSDFLGEFLILERVDITGYYSSEYALSKIPSPQFELFTEDTEIAPTLTNFSLISGGYQKGSGAAGSIEKQFSIGENNQLLAYGPYIRYWNPEAATFNMDFYVGAELIDSFTGFGTGDGSPSLLYFPYSTKGFISSEDVDSNGMKIEVTTTSSTLIVYSYRLMGILDSVGNTQFLELDDEGSSSDGEKFTVTSEATDFLELEDVDTETEGTFFVLEVGPDQEYEDGDSDSEGSGFDLSIAAVLGNADSFSEGEKFDFATAALELQDGESDSDGEEIGYTPILEVNMEQAVITEQGFDYVGVVFGQELKARIKIGPDLKARIKP